MPMQHPMVTHGMQVNTPPPTSDDGMASGSLEPNSPEWASPRSRPSPLKTRVARPVKAKRRTGKATDRKAKPKMSGPLSEITHHLTHVPVRDMEEWVRRPIEVRHQEVIKRNGKIARPMNSFMLYRSAYAERAKEWFSQNNHQVVSTAAGDSWKMEPREVREKYERLASIEKNNHLKAHPGYKFTPSKVDKEKRNRQSLVGDDRPELSVQDHTPASSPFFHNRGMSSDVDSSGWKSRDSTPFDIQDHGLPMGSYISSSWPTSTPSSRSVPGIMASPEPAAHYLHSSVHSGMVGHVEDLGLRKFDMQELQYASSNALAGLPGAAHHDLLQQTSVAAPGTNGGQMDPQLLSIHPNEEGSPVFSQPQYMWPEGPNNYLPATAPMEPGSVQYPVSAAYQPGMQPMVHHEAGLDASGDFDQWINPHGNGY
ncbi:hypothetical protein AWENTII_004753 [Aspergillus wentii]